jgi:LPXTG-motif cell wall-anchored protein
MTRNCTLQGGAAVVCHEGDAPGAKGDGMTAGSIALYAGLPLLLLIVGGGAFYVYNKKKKALPR